MNVVLFRDRDKSYKIDSTGFNKTGVVTSNGLVVFPNGRKVKTEKFEKTSKCPHLLRRLETDVKLQKIDQFFFKNFQSPNLFNMGLNAVVENDLEYFSSPIKLPLLNKESLLVKEASWRRLCTLVQVSDFLCTFNSHSVTSKIITNIDQGPGSHIAMCTGEGTIVEVITEGVVEKPLSVYEGPEFHVGLYRTNNPEKEQSVEMMRSRIGNGYNYKGAMLAGTQKFFKAKRYAPTPADFIISSRAELLCYI
jgi:hypothetical protein